MRGKKGGAGGGTRNGWRAAETGIDRRQNESVAYHSLSLGLVRDPHTSRHYHYTSDGGVLTDEEEVGGGKGRGDEDGRPIRA